MSISDDTVNTCNGLLRGEISAVEAYTQAINAYADSPEGAALESIRTAHQDNADALQQFILRCGAEPATGSGVWGGVVQTLEGAATQLGEPAALKMLQTGEEHGANEYRNALAIPTVSEEAKELIRHQLLPPITAHLIDLQQRIDRAA